MFQCCKPFSLALLVVQIVMFQLFNESVINVSAILLHKAAFQRNTVPYDILYISLTYLSHFITALRIVAQHILTAQLDQGFPDGGG